MRPYYEQGNVRLLHGDCSLLLPTLDANSVDAIVTDPPAGIDFMGKDWDCFRRRRNPADAGRDDVFGRTSQHAPHSYGESDRHLFIRYMMPIFAECLRVAKPGAHALVWALPRTSHWTATALEDAGWEIRDSVYHLFGQGFPKSLDVSKAIDKAAGAKREVVGKSARHIAKGEAATSSLYAQDEWTKANGRMGEHITAPATPVAAQWQGWGTALKPAVECWWLCRKPLSERNVAANVTRWGTGAINIDGCRVETDEGGKRQHNGAVYEGVADGYKRPNASMYTHKTDWAMPPAGRWPSHLTLDEEAARMLDQQSGTRLAGAYPKLDNDFTGKSPITFRGAETRAERINLESGGASRFFYAAKASRAEREQGLWGMERTTERILNGGITSADHPDSAPGGGDRIARNAHPTVKPIALMRWLCRLITPPGGLILDPFAGSGTTGCAAIAEGFRFLGIERDEAYCAIAAARLQAEPVPLPLEV